MTIYETIVTITYQDKDMDMCPIWVDEDVYKDLFETEEAAIAAANREFNSREPNGYVRSVWAQVYPITVTDNGSHRCIRIYNQYKELN